MIAKKTGYALKALEAQGVRSGGLQVSEDRTPIRSGLRRRIESDEDPRNITERMLILACLQDKRALANAISENAAELIRNDTYKAMFLAMCEQGSSFSAAKYIGELDEKDAEIASAVLKEEEAMENAAKTVTDCIRRMRRESAEDEIAALQEKLHNPDLTAEERNAVLKEITERIRANK